MGEWNWCTWGDLATLEYGKALSGYRDSPGIIPVYGTNGPIGWTDEPLCDFPSVIVGRKGAYRGIHYSPVPFFVIDTAFYLKPLPGVGFDTKWAYYSLLTQDINLMDSGSAIPSTSRDDFYALEVALPPIEWQREIVSILSAFDDKIEANCRMNETLEATARAIFKSWFVDFDPVHYKADGQIPPGMDTETAALFPDSFEESELGLIPRGWRVGTLRDCCVKVENGGTPKRSESDYWNPPSIAWLTSGEVRQSIITATDNFISEIGLKNSSAKVWESGTTVVALYGATAGQVSLLAIPCTANQACCGLTPLQNMIFYVYLHTSGSVEALGMQARGSAQQNLSQSLVANFPAIIPDDGVLNSFHEVASPIFEKWVSNLEESRSLAETRDALLPKLVSGEIRVGEV